MDDKKDELERQMPEFNSWDSRPGGTTQRVTVRGYQWTDDEGEEQVGFIWPAEHSASGYGEIRITGETTSGWWRWRYLWMPVPFGPGIYRWLVRRSGEHER